ncbi:hypothetical protein HYE67_008178 [Fusarium culmorum]|uniref:BTB domain-containing protein n=1 Tax=Fusarium culmorum TaxID=5516 RepID=A0A7S8DCA0_FUSCU|nr:hypothetical protein HYE67_008178 [Fusarium culmorum]
MAPIMHTVDPDGDLVVVLKKPNTKNVIPEVSLRQEVNLGKDDPTFAPDATDVKVPLMSSGLPNKATLAEASNEIRFLVSSRHLTMASHMFKTMLSQRWTQPEAVNAQSDSTDADATTSTVASVKASSLSDGTDSPAPPMASSINASPSSPSPSRIPLTKEVVISEWHAYALLTVFNAIHGKCYSVSRRVSLEFFAQVAAIADYLQCAEALSVITDLWHSCSRKRSDKYGKEAIMWFYISWVFSSATVFIETARLIVQAGEGLDRVITHDLPIFEILG